MPNIHTISGLSPCGIFPNQSPRSAASSYAKVRFIFAKKGNPAAAGFRSGLFDGSEYRHRHLRDDGVAAGFQALSPVSGGTDGNAVHPSGKPIIHSVMAGCKRNFAPVALPMVSAKPVLWDVPLRDSLRPVFSQYRACGCSTSCVVTVGKSVLICVARLGMVVPFRYFAIRFLNCSTSCSVSAPVTVSNNPDAVSPVRRTDGASWNNKRLDFVTFAFQVSAHGFENHALVPSSEATHVFSDDPVRADIPDDRQHCRPEVAVVCRSLSSSSVGEGLAGEAAGEDGMRSGMTAGSGRCFPRCFRR